MQFREVSCDFVVTGFSRQDNHVIKWRTSKISSVAFLQANAYIYSTKLLLLLTLGSHKSFGHSVNQEPEFRPLDDDHENIKARNHIRDRIDVRGLSARGQY
jgi:hypothetical protein